MTTIRKVLEFPRMVREMNERLDPLDAELAVMREINWQLNKLASEEEVAQCMQFLMEHRSTPPPRTQEE
jgi:hypothetical protein